MKPILFNSDMVRAILAGQKTQTRRLMKPQPELNGAFWEYAGAGWSTGIDRVQPVPMHSLYNRAPYHPGDILYVRETWTDTGTGILYAADQTDDKADGIKWKPSIHMSKEAARIFLRVKNVHVQRLQSISSEDCIAEGIPPCSNKDLCLEDCSDCLINSPRRRFRILWNSTIKKSDLRRAGWDADPWVWVIEFERCEREE